MQNDAGYALTRGNIHKGPNYGNISRGVYYGKQRVYM